MTGAPGTPTDPGPGDAPPDAPAPPPEGAAPPRGAAAGADGAAATSRSALAVGGGILLSRITGFLRDVVIAYFFGTSVAAGAYTAALKIPNVLRNLLGEGMLSASFVPVYSALLARRDAPSARRLARAVLGLLLLLAGLLTGVGILLAPWLTRMVAPGFDPAATALTTDLVRILFPMAGVMILAAWCLGVLNSHRRFFLPFAAPVAWNLAQIGGLFLGAWAGWEGLIYVLAWSTVAGSLLQLAVQLPAARRLAGTLRPALAWAWEPLRRVRRNMAPVVASQGISQVSSFMDVLLASFVSTGAVAALGYAQRLAYLPLSLFGTSVATAALPEMSRDTAAEALRGHLVEGWFRILYFVLPSAVAFLLFGDLMVRVLFQRGAFGAASTAVVGWIVAAYALALVASSAVRLFAGGFHALQDTRTPMRIAVVAITVGTAAGAGLMFWLRARLDGTALEDAAAAGLALGGAVGAWLNLSLLWDRLGRRIGPLFGRPALAGVLRLAAAALAAGAAGVLARRALDDLLEPRGFLGAALLLAGTLLAAGVPYLAIARTPARFSGTPTDTRPER